MTNLINIGYKQFSSTKLFSVTHYSSSLLKVRWAHLCTLQYNNIVPSAARTVINIIYMSDVKLLMRKGLFEWYKTSHTHKHHSTIISCKTLFPVCDVWTKTNIFHYLQKVHSLLPILALKAVHYGSNGTVIFLILFTLSWVSNIKLKWAS